MKKIICVIISIFTSVAMYSININDISGEWVTDSCKLTINVDTLIFDSEYEGDIYTYEIKGDYIIYQSEIDKIYNNFNILKIVYIDKNVIGIKYEDDDNIYTFNKNI